MHSARTAQWIWRPSSGEWSPLLVLLPATWRCPLFALPNCLKVPSRRKISHTRTPCPENFSRFGRLVKHYCSPSQHLCGVLQWGLTAMPEPGPKEPPLAWNLFRARNPPVFTPAGAGHIRCDSTVWKLNHSVAAVPSLDQGRSMDRRLPSAKSGISVVELAVTRDVELPRYNFCIGTVG